MKIAVITFCNNGNYGSELQATAMNQLCNSFGHKAEFCTIKSPKKKERVFEVILSRLKNAICCITNKEYRSFYKNLKLNIKRQQVIDIEQRKRIKDYVNNEFVTRRISKKDFRKDLYDFYICGSDQIWSPVIMPFKKEYYCDFVSPNKKLAYAPSMGINNIPKFYLKKAVPYIADFKYLSVREQCTKELIEENTGNVAKLVLDPTLTVGKEFWEEKIGQYSKIDMEEPYVLCYFLGDISIEKINVINNYANGRKIILLPYKGMAEHFINSQYVSANPIDFVNLIKNSDFVFTDSFHGCCFSIIFEKQFFVFERDHKKEIVQTSRISSLLDLFGLSDRIFNRAFFYENEIDYNSVNNILKIKKEESLEFLAAALKTK